MPLHHSDSQRLGRVRRVLTAVFPKVSEFMGETKQAKKDRLESKAHDMRARNGLAVQPDPKHEAYRQGHMDALAGVRRRAPFATPALRAAWYAGYAAGSNGLRVTLPASGLIVNKTQPPAE